MCVWPELVRVGQRMTVVSGNVSGFCVCWSHMSLLPAGAACCSTNCTPHTNTPHPPHYHTSPPTHSLKPQTRHDKLKKQVPLQQVLLLGPRLRLAVSRALRRPAGNILGG